MANRPRKPWDSLSLDYRTRLLKHGIGPAEHARGESIKAARGHKATPEHGLSDRTLRRRVKAKKRSDFGDAVYINSPRHRTGTSSFDPDASDRQVDDADLDDPDVRQAMIDYLEDDLSIMDIGDDEWTADDSIYSFLMYHGNT